MSGKGRVACGGQGCTAAVVRGQCCSSKQPEGVGGPSCVEGYAAGVTLTGVGRGRRNPPGRGALPHLLPHTGEGGESLYVGECQWGYLVVCVENCSKNDSKH